MIQNYKDAQEIAKDRYLRMQIPIYIIETEKGFLLATQAELPFLSIEYQMFETKEIIGHDFE